MSEAVVIGALLGVLIAVCAFCLGHMMSSRMHNRAMDIAINDFQLSIEYACRQMDVDPGKLRSHISLHMRELLKEWKRGNKEEGHHGAGD